MPIYHACATPRPYVRARASKFPVSLAVENHYRDGTRHAAGLQRGGGGGGGGRVLRGPMPGTRLRQHDLRLSPVQLFITLQVLPGTPHPVQNATLRLQRRGPAAPLCARQCSRVKMCELASPRRSSGSTELLLHPISVRTNGRQPHGQYAGPVLSAHRSIRRNGAERAHQQAAPAPLEQPAGTWLTYRRTHRDPSSQSTPSPDLRQSPCT